MSQSTRPTYDMDIHQGTTFTRTLTIEEPAGTPVDITTYTFKAEIKKNKTDSTALDEFTITLSDPTNGILTMSLTDTETSALPAIIGFYDLIMTDGSSAKSRILEGRVTITQQVTIEP
jgi:hypothetical protein